MIKKDNQTESSNNSSASQHDFKNCSCEEMQSNKLLKSKVNQIRIGIILLITLSVSIVVALYLLYIQMTL